MRILLLNDFRIGGGAEIIFQKTYEVLVKQGYDVDMVYHNGRISPQGSIFSYVFSIKNFRIILKRLREGKYDIIYVLNYAYSFSPSILWAIKKYKRKNPNIRVIYNAHDAHLICPNSGLMYFKDNKMHLFPQILGVKDFIFKTLDHRGHVYSILKKIQWLFAYKILKLHSVFDVILCPSLFLVSKIKECYPNKNVCLLRNTLYMKNISLAILQKEKKASLQLVYFGRLSLEKGLDVLIKNLSKVSDLYELHIYGDGPEAINLHKLVNDLNMQDRIFFRGKLPWKELMSRLPLYDAFVLPSCCYENAPLSIIEAVASGLYILTMNYGGMKELAQIVGNYYFINPLSPERLYGAFDFIKKSGFHLPDLSLFSEDTFKNILSEYIEYKQNGTIGDSHITN